MTHNSIPVADLFQIVERHSSQLQCHALYSVREIQQGKSTKDSKIQARFIRQECICSVRALGTELLAKVNKVCDKIDASNLSMNKRLRINLKNCCNVS